MPVAQPIKAELRRLVLAQSDLRWAATLFDEVARETDPSRSWRLWEAAVNAYGRPFKRASLEVGREWSAFDDPDLTRLHKELLTLRDKVFAHNDVTIHRHVVVVPPDGAAERRPTRTFADPRKVIGPKRLISAQITRIDKRITELAESLCFGQGWYDGVELDLIEVDDKLELKSPPSPFQPPSNLDRKSEQ